MIRMMGLLALLVLGPMTTVSSGQVRIGPQGPVVEDDKRQGRQVSSNPDAPSIVQLTLTPAPEPDPPLKYSLIPGYLEREPGNAASYYYRAIILFQSVQRQMNEDGLEERYDELMRQPVSEADWKLVESTLASFHSSYEQLEIAAHREYCDWDWRLRDVEGFEVLSFLLPEMHELRSMARLVALKARYEIGQQRYGDALETLTVGFQMARDAAQPPTLVNALVGLAIAQMMQEQVAAFVDSPDAPNLYWALAELPYPLIDMEPAMVHERSTPLLMFSVLREAETARRSPEQWQEALVQMIVELHRAGDGFLSARTSEELRQQAQLMASAVAVKEYPRAKEELIAAGYERSEIEQMPVAQVLLIHQLHSYRTLYGNYFKWYLVARERPLAESIEMMRKSMPQDFSSQEILPLAESLLPALAASVVAEARQASHLAALRTVEAIRMHAAVHAAKFPSRLTEITVVPVPDDPLTGESFSYQKEGETAKLEVRAVHPYPASLGWVFEIREDR